jgi:hypothetical protein
MVLAYCSVTPQQDPHSHTVSTTNPVAQIGSYLKQQALDRTPSQYSNAPSSRQRYGISPLSAQPLVGQGARTSLTL